MRPKLIALTKSMKSSRQIRGALGHVILFEDLERVAAEHIAQFGTDIDIGEQTSTSSQS
jgi:hypothetical protein